MLELVHPWGDTFSLCLSPAKVLQGLWEASARYSGVHGMHGCLLTFVGPIVAVGLLIITLAAQ